MECNSCSISRSMVRPAIATERLAVEGIVGPEEEDPPDTVEFRVGDICVGVCALELDTATFWCSSWCTDISGSGTITFTDSHSRRPSRRHDRHPSIASVLELWVHVLARHVHLALDNLAPAISLHEGLVHAWLHHLPNVHDQLMSLPWTRQFSYGRRPCEALVLSHITSRIRRQNILLSRLISPYRLSNRIAHRWWMGSVTNACSCWFGMSSLANLWCGLTRFTCELRQHLCDNETTRLPNAVETKIRWNEWHQVLCVSWHVKQTLPIWFVSWIHV